MTRLDQELVARGLTPTRSQAESLIKLGKVKLNGQVEKKAARQVNENYKIELDKGEQYVSRAGLKLAGAAAKFNLDFNGKTVLDVGSSTGGFTQVALTQGAKKVVAVDVGTDQMHPSLKGNERLTLHEKTDIREFNMTTMPDIVVIDVSFISLRQILPAVAALSKPATQIVAMVKPQFESTEPNMHKGVVKNDRMRRDILKDFENWCRGRFIILDKADSEVAGAKGNLERFYLLKKQG